MLNPSHTPFCCPDPPNIAATPGLTPGSAVRRRRPISVRVFAWTAFWLRSAVLDARTAPLKLTARPSLVATVVIPETKPCGFWVTAS